MGRREQIRDEKIKKWTYFFGIILVFCIFSFFIIFYLYNKNLNKIANESLTEFATIEEIVPNDDVEVTSVSEDKTIDTVVLNDVQNKNLTLKGTEKSVEIKEESEKEEEKNVAEAHIIETVKTEVQNETQENVVEVNEIIEESVETQSDNINENTILEFVSPVSGEIIKDYAEDTLVYSKTLDEWGTHFGIDIKASKTTIVKASEKGVIEKINTDPRYGNSITINHGNGFKTVYSSLLVSDFFEVGEEVEKGDSIGTVGDSASFEIADDAHLHFEMYKDGVNVNPTLYLK